MSDGRLREAYKLITSQRSASDRIRCIPPDDLLALAEHRLSTSRRLEALDHIMDCSACRQEFELLRAIRRAGEVIE